MASGPVEQLEVTEGAGGAGRLSDCGEQETDEVTPRKRVIVIDYG